MKKLLTTLENRQGQLAPQPTTSTLSKQKQGIPECILSLYFDSIDHDIAPTDTSALSIFRYNGKISNRPFHSILDSLC